MVFTDPTGHFWNFVAALVVSALIATATHFAIQAFKIEGTAAKLFNTFSAGLSALATGGLSLGLEGARLGAFITAAEATSLALQTGEGREIVGDITEGLEGFGVGSDAASFVAYAIASTVVNSVAYVGLNALGQPDATSPTTSSTTTAEQELVQEQFDALGVGYEPLSEISTEGSSSVSDRLQLLSRFNRGGRSFSVIDYGAGGGGGGPILSGRGGAASGGKFRWPSPFKGAPGPHSTPRYSPTSLHFPKPPRKISFWWHIAGAFAAGAKLGYEIYKNYTGRDPLQERSTYGK